MGNQLSVIRVSIFAVASVLVATTSTTEAFGVAPGGGRGISGARGRILYSQVEESVKPIVDSAPGNSKKGAVTQRGLAQQRDESPTKAPNRGLSSILHFNPLGCEAKEEDRGDHESVPAVSKSLFGMSTPSRKPAPGTKAKSEASTNAATVKSGLFHFIQENEELVNAIETRQQEMLHTFEEEGDSSHGVVEEETRLPVADKTAEADANVGRFGSSFVRHAPLEEQRPQAATGSRSKRAVTSLIAGAQPTLLPRPGTETTTNNDSEGDDNAPKAVVSEPASTERIPPPTNQQTPTPAFKKDATDYLSLLEKRQDEMTSRGKFDVDGEHDSLPLTSILEHDPPPTTPDPIVDSNNESAFAKPNPLSESQRLALLEEVRSRQALEAILGGSSLSVMLEGKAKALVVTDTLKDGVAKTRNPEWLEEILEASTDDDQDHNRILTSILNDDPSPPQQDQPFKDDLLLALRLALNESKSRRTLEEILGGKSLEEMLEAKEIVPPTAHDMLDKESTLQDMLKSKDGDNYEKQRDLILSSILDNSPQPDITQRVLDRSSLLLTLSSALEEAKSKRTLKEILDGRSLDEMLEATTTSQATALEDTGVPEGMHVLENTGLNIDVLEELLEAKPAYEMKTLDEEVPTEELKPLPPAQVPNPPVLSKAEAQHRSDSHHGRKKKPAFSYWDTVSPTEISSELIDMFTPERSLLQLVKEDVNDLETLQFAVSRLAWGVIKGGTAAFVGVGTAVAGAPQDETIKMASESTQSLVSSGTAFAALLWKSSKALLERIAENNKETNDVHDSSDMQEQPEQANDVVGEASQTDRNEFFFAEE